MATFTSTAKYALRWLTGSNLISDIDLGFQTLASDVEANMAGYAEGTLAGRPAAGKNGRLYRCTDTSQVFLDSGSAWNELARPAADMGAYRTVSEALFSFVNTHTAGTWVASTSSTAVLVGTTSPIAQAIIPITLADYAVSGLTTQFRVQAATITNNAAPAVNFVYSLGLVAGLSGTGGSIGISSVTLNPTNVTRAAPGGVTANVDSTADFTVSSSGVYVLCVTLSGAPAANSNTVCALRLQVHNV